MANAISLSRLPLLFLLAWMALRPPGWWQIAATLVLIGVFILDGVDGAVARRRGEESPFGAVLDIGVDRAVELGAWFLLIGLGMAPLWAALIFVMRGALVDSLRAARLEESGVVPFDAFSNPLARWIVKGRFMRIFYAALKATTFSWLLVLSAMPVLIGEPWPALWEALAPWAGGIGHLLIWLTVAVCLLRGAPDLLVYPRLVKAGLASGGRGRSTRDTVPSTMPRDIVPEGDRSRVDRGSG